MSIALIWKPTGDTLVCTRSVGAVGDHSNSDRKLLRLHSEHIPIRGAYRRVAKALAQRSLFGPGWSQE